MPAEFDASRLYRDAARFAAAPSKLDTAVRRAASDLQRRLIPEATRVIGRDLNLSASRIRKGLSVRRSGDAVQLTASGEGIGIAQGYGARATPDGVVATLVRDSGPELFRHAFIKQVRSGPQAFERGGPGAPRYPLDRLFSTSIAGAIRLPRRADSLGDFGINRLTAEVQRQLGIL